MYRTFIVLILLGRAPDHRTATVSNSSTTNSFTDKQGQYLAFIYAYTKLHRRPPAEADMQAFFEVTPPSVHNMVLELEKRGLIRRRPGQARSIELLLPPETLPVLR
jgi:DNA-binding MarR family transcriptional regulator